jgi:indole-3-glycerol phosphate synthase
MTATLDDIIEHQRQMLAWKKQTVSAGALRAMAAAAAAPRDFATALTHRNPASPPMRVIAEVKRRSPSAGLIRPEYEGESFAPESIAGEYEQAGAAAISCLTNEAFFDGHLSFIARIKSAVSIPVLRKEFIIDPWQVIESRAAGADAILLIAECLEGDSLMELATFAASMEMGVLVEIHAAAHFERALRVVSELNSERVRALLGVNNRDLATMKVDLAHTGEIASLMTDRTVLVSESGIRTPDDIRTLQEMGVRITLVGEQLMRQRSPGFALSELLGAKPTRESTKIASEGTKHD